MRIIGGQAKGRRIFVPKGQIRPTSDTIREALFNILPSMKGKLFLDLFAGTGSVGLEALSRGAEKAVFVEVDFLFVEAIKKSLNICGFDNSYEIISGPVEKGIKLLSTRKDRFNIIFADPPYEKGLIKITLQLLSRSHHLVTEDGVVIMQHSLREKSEFDDDNYVLLDQRRYGDTIISFLELNTRG